MAPPPEPAPQTADPGGAGPVLAEPVRPGWAASVASRAPGAAGFFDARSAASARSARPAADARPASVLRGLPWTVLAPGQGGADRPAVALHPLPDGAATGPAAVAVRRGEAVAAGRALVVPAGRLDAFLAPFAKTAALPGVTVALDALVDGEAVPIRLVSPPVAVPASPPTPSRSRKVRLRRRRDLAAAPPVPGAPLSAMSRRMEARAAGFPRTALPPGSPPSTGRPPAAAPRRGLLAGALRRLAALLGGGRRDG